VRGPSVGLEEMSLVGAGPKLHFRMACQGGITPRNRRLRNRASGLPFQLRTTSTIRCAPLLQRWIECADQPVVKKKATCVWFIADSVLHAVTHLSDRHWNEYLSIFHRRFRDKAMKFRPLHDRVVVKRAAAPETKVHTEGKPKCPPRLRQVLKSYASYYNASRTHRALAKDAPASRAFQRVGRTVSHALVRGTASSIRPNLSFQTEFSASGFSDPSVYCSDGYQR
jgi:hypothetical protein